MSSRMKTSSSWYSRLKTWIRTLGIVRIHHLIIFSKKMRIMETSKHHPNLMRQKEVPRVLQSSRQSSQMAKLRKWVLTETNSPAALCEEPKASISSLMKKKKTTKRMIILKISQLRNWIAPTFTLKKTKGQTGPWWKVRSYKMAAFASSRLATTKRLKVVQTIERIKMNLMKFLMVMPLMITCMKMTLISQVKLYVL